MQRVSVYRYIAYNPTCRIKAESFLREFGYNKPRNANELASMLADSVNRHGEKALKGIAEIHPDRKLILDSNNYQGHGSYHADGDNGTVKKIETDTESFLKEHSRILLIGTLVIAGIALITRNQ